MAMKMRVPGSPSAACKASAWACVFASNGEPPPSSCVHLGGNRRAALRHQLGQTIAQRLRHADDGGIVEQVEQKRPNRRRRVRAAEIEQDDRSLGHGRSYRGSGRVVARVCVLVTRGLPTLQISLSAAKRGRGKGPVALATGRVRWCLPELCCQKFFGGATHLTLPTLCVGPLPLPPLRGRRG